MFYKFICTVLNGCPDVESATIFVILLCILGGTAIGATGVLALQELRAKRGEKPE